MSNNEVTNRTIREDFAVGLLLSLLVTVAAGFCAPWFVTASVGGLAAWWAALSVRQMLRVQIVERESELDCPGVPLPNPKDGKQ